MLFMKDDYFENSDYRELNMWATSFGAGRSPREQLLAFRFAEACDRFKIKNVLALWAYGATKSTWFSKAPRDREGQIRWCEALASEYARLGDIRLMDLTEDETVIMTLIWTQAANRLDEYARFKKPVEPRLPTKPTLPPVGEKKEEPKVEVPREPTKPKPSDKESPPKVEESEKSRTMKIIGAVASILAVVIAWLPIPAPVKAGVKIILNAIASIFR